MIRQPDIIFENTPESIARTYSQLRTLLAMGKTIGAGPDEILVWSESKEAIDSLARLIKQDMPTPKHTVA